MGNFSGDGEPCEYPSHEVKLDSFYIGTHEVTFDEYDKYWNETQGWKSKYAPDLKPFPKDMGWGRGKRPVINISWYDAIDYCNWLSKKMKLRKCYSGVREGTVCDFSANGYRLPTSAEWEYAARELGKNNNFGNGKSTSSKFDIRFDSNSTKPVGSYAPNSLGLYDMSGNACEWCWDWFYREYYHKKVRFNPKGAKGGFERVLRGGCYYSKEKEISTTAIQRDFPKRRSKRSGFRLVRSKL